MTAVELQIAATVEGLAAAVQDQSMVAMELQVVTTVDRRKVGHGCRGGPDRGCRRAGKRVNIQIKTIAMLFFV